MVALTAGAVACALAGDAGGCLQGGPSTKFSHMDLGLEEGQYLFAEP